MSYGFLRKRWYQVEKKHIEALLREIDTEKRKHTKIDADKIIRRAKEELEKQIKKGPE